MGKFRSQIRDLVSVEDPRPSVQTKQDKKPRQKIHSRTGHKNQQFLSKSLAYKRPVISCVLIFPLHGAKTTDRQCPEGVLRFLPLSAPDSGTHTDGKLIDPYTAELCRQKVAQLMDCHQNAEYQNCRQDIDQLHAKCSLLTISRASRSASKISSSVGCSTTGRAAMAFRVKWKMS